MNKNYRVRLTDEERHQLQKLVRKGKAHARKLIYARILLKADEDGPDHWTDERIADALEVSVATVARERKRYCEEGLEIALMPKKPGLQETGSGRTGRSAPARFGVFRSSGGKREVEISVLVRQCLKRRLPDMETLGREATAWCAERNRLGASVDWRFRTEDARMKLRSLYPSTESWALRLHWGQQRCQMALAAPILICRGN